MCMQQICYYFFSLKVPYQGMSAATVARILDQAIELAGAADPGFTTKDFRLTTATEAVEKGINLDTI